MTRLPQPRTADPLVVRVLQEYRARVDGAETAILEDMGRRWIEIENKLRSDIDALALEMVRRFEAGETVTEQMIFRAERYRIVAGRLADEIEKYNQDFAVNRITSAQEQFAILGIDAAQDAITSMYPSPLSASFNRINVNAVESLFGLAGDGSPLRDLLVNDFGDASDGILNALVNGVARGLNPTQIAADMADGMGLGLDRALLIARTEAARAYRTGSTEQYRDSGVVEGFMRLVKKETACPVCLMLDGERFTLAEELSDHPRGKCTAVPIVEGVAPPDWQKGPEWFEAQSEERQIEIIGREKWEMWQAGEIQLSDLARKTTNPVWGDSPRPATLAELRGGTTTTTRPRPTPPPTPAALAAAPTVGRGEFTPAKTREEAEQRLGAFIKGGTFPSGVRGVDPISGVHFEGLPLDQLNSVLKGIEDVAQRYGTSYNYVGYQWKRKSSMGYYSTFLPGSSLQDLSAIGIQKTFLRNSEKDRADIIEKFLFNRDHNILFYQNILSKGIDPTQIQRARDKLSILESMTRWVVGTDPGVDIIEQVARHESYHGVYFQHKLDGTFRQFLKDLGVLQVDWYKVSEYAGDSVKELFAEAATAIDLGVPIPDNIRDAVLGTLEEVKK